MKLLIFWSLLIHIFQVRSQEYDDSSDIADILKIKDFGSDSNDTIEENFQEVEEVKEVILATDLPLFDHHDANGNETITEDEDSNATNETSTDQPLLGVETTTFPQDLGEPIVDVNPNGRFSPEKAFTPLVEDDTIDEDAVMPNASNSAPNYEPGKLPRPRFVMLGQQGVGKSSMANTLLGFDNLAALSNKKIRKTLRFKIGHGLRSKTKKTSFSTGKWLGTGPNVTVVDTPGFKDTDDAAFVDEIMSVLGDEVKEVDSFLIVYKYKDRFTTPFKRTLSMLTKMFGNFWTNVVLVVNFWSFKSLHVEEREKFGVTTESYAKDLKGIFQKKFDLDFEIPLVFIDTHYNKSNPEEADEYRRQTDFLWKVSMNRKPFQCLTRKDVQDKLKREKEDLVAMKRKCKMTNRQNKDYKQSIRKQSKQIKAQEFVMNNLRNGIDYLKEHCSKNSADNLIGGCKWSEWTEWSECTKTCGGGKEMRVREKLPAMYGACDGGKEEMRVCDNEVCPMETDATSMVMVIGGETSVSRENEHSASVEIIGPNGLCRRSGVPDLPEARGKLCAAYDPSGAVIVCGGGERFYRPNSDCWQLVSGLSKWQKIPPMFPVHGAATAFYQQKFWVLGGATGDDSYDESITDKVQAYNPRSQQWTVELPLTSRRHKACAVAIDDILIVTGGTMLGLGKIKPQWLYNIGSPKVEQFDGTSWTELPSMNRAKVEHGCTVATIDDSRGILVVGGATGDDLVEFLDWEKRQSWKTLGKINRGRGMMPGVGFIGGKLSLIGGYSWPGGVELIEQWEDDTVDEEWQKTPLKLDYPRYNHATVTVPGEMFPKCINPE